MSARGPNYGWLTTFSQFPRENLSEVRSALEAFVRNAGSRQLDAWGTSLPIVRDASRAVCERIPQTAGDSILFEYELPREGGRRPDVVLLGNGSVVVLEFKGKQGPTHADLDQVAAYARDIRNYHQASRGRSVRPVLVPTGMKTFRGKYDDVEVVSPDQLDSFLTDVAKHDSGSVIDGDAWAQSDYSPLPSLVDAAREIFFNRPLPHIRRAQSAGIPQTVELLVSIASEAAQTRQRHLVLLTGVPGAGKTLVGLQFVHHPSLEELSVQQAGRAQGAPAVFLSGNGPLVKVLRHALRGPNGEEKIFVDGIKAYLKQYLLRKTPRVPPEHILVFDEAQRAWDAEEILEKHSVSASEPELVLQLGGLIPRWCVVLGLIGEGQEIHRGEEAGLSQWAQAITKSRHDWVVHAPPKLASVFAPCGTQIRTSTHLDLTTTLRSHLSSEVHEWVRQLLTATPETLREVRRLTESVRESGFRVYVTRDVGVAAEYVKGRYEGQLDKRYGLLASSRAKNLEALGIDNTFQATKQLREGPWFGDSPSSPFSCCQLRAVATEFQSQGLELDCPIVCWGDDLTWDNGWRVAKRRLGERYKDPDRLRMNSYRVLLTRGRDGLVIFVPSDQGDGMDRTAEMIMAVGVTALGSGSDLS